MPDPELERLTTEARLPASARLDELDPAALVALMNAEDQKVAGAVARSAGAIARALDGIAERLRGGGRLFYVGAGTSGRLGVLDASECPPTFGCPPGQVVAVIAGGPAAITAAAEGAEDDAAQGARDLRERGAGPRDAVVGISASGRTPYVLGALAHARDAGALTVGIACNEPSPVLAASAIPIPLPVGPEVLAGSTRLKAGTATKMVLNMLSTGAFVRLGKTYGNLMVDVAATNEKLRARALRIVRAATGATDGVAAAALAAAGGEAKTAIVALARSVDPDQARRLLALARGHVRQALAMGRD
jgi:N-acetylmuramic acid 6-phosphate etherase